MAERTGVIEYFEINEKIVDFLMKYESWTFSHIEQKIFFLLELYRNIVLSSALQIMQSVAQMKKESSK